MVSTALVVLIVSSLRAQLLSVSMGGGYELGKARINFTRLNNNRYNNAFEGVVDNVSVFGEVAVPWYDDYLAVIRLSGYSGNVAFRAPMPDVPVVIPGVEEPINYETQEEITFSIQAIQLELLARIKLFEGMSLTAGPVVGYRTVQDYRHSQLFDPQMVVEHRRPISQFPYWADDGHTWVIDDGSSLQRNHLAIGALITAEYELPLTQQLLLVPELRLRGDFTSPFANTDWNLFSAGGALSIRYSL
jgi:hypothetical protein